MPRIDRRQFLKTAAALPAAAVLSPARPARAAPHRPAPPRAADRELVVVDGWVLLRSDLELLARP